MATRKKTDPNAKIVAQNRRARHDYFITDTIEAGIMLAGTEVKSLRDGKGNIRESYAAVEEGAIWLVNAYIPEYQSKSPFGHETRRKRKLLLHRREMDRLIDAVGRKGASLVPLSIYFNERGIAKVALAMAEGKKKSDKRDAIKERDWKRDQARLLREKG